MQKKYQVSNNGQQVITDDLNLLGEMAGLSDDYVLAEIFRLTPYNGSSATKGVLPFSHATSTAIQPLVGPSGADGKVIVRPFRAFVSSRTAVATDNRKNLQDIRSGLSLAYGATASSLDTTVSITANSSGNPRWDLVYAAVSVDANSSSVTRKIKDPTTKAITATSVVTSKITSIALGAIAGTAAASPVWPTITADSDPTYYIPLAYVRVPNGFNGSSTVAKTAIAEVAPCLQISRAMGVASAGPANAMQSLTSTQQQAWGSSGTRPGWFLPSTMVGEETLYLALDLTTGSVSHATGVTLDSRDWRGRVCHWSAFTGSGVFDWDTSALSVSTEGIINPDAVGADCIILDNGDRGYQEGWSTTFHKTVGAGSPGVMRLNTSTTLVGADVQVYCDFSDGGKLKLSYSGAPNALIFATLRFSPPFHNAAWV